MDTRRDPELICKAPRYGDRSVPVEEEFLGVHDLANCYTLFLGRMPAGDLDRPRTTNLYELIRDISQTKEFKTVILPPLLLREALPKSLLNETILLPLIDWAQRRLPLVPATRCAVGGARTWAQMLELLLADSRLSELTPELAAAGVNVILRKRLENEPLIRVKRSVVGAIDAVSGFEVRGWAADLCDKSIPVVLEFYAENTFVGAACCNEPRPDVADVVGGDGRFGFTFRISTAQRATFAGGHALVAVDSVSRESVGTAAMVYFDAARNFDAINAIRSEVAQVRQVLDRIEARLPEASRLSSIPLEAYSEYWERFYRPMPESLAKQRAQCARFAYRPLISVILPTWNSGTRLLAKAIDSVLAQTYVHWEIVICDDASDGSELKLLRQRYVGRSEIQWLEASSREGIAANTNRGIAASHGDYVVFLDHDDELAPEALYHVASQLQNRQYGLLYSDEDRIEEDQFGRCLHHTPFFKPDFDPDLLMAMNYICHLVALRRDVIDSVGGLRTGFEGAQDHDLLLRVVSHLSTRDIMHLPHVLYHWRVTPGSVSRTPILAEQIQKNIVAAVEEHLNRLDLTANVESHTDPIGMARQFATRVRWQLPPSAPKVSIIVATRDRVDLLQPCLNSILDSLLSYPGEHEILLVDNESVETPTLTYLDRLKAESKIRLLHFRGPFNWSAINNAAAQEALGEVLIFLNNDTIVLTKDWCIELVANALRGDVGAVGARLLYADGMIQHAGVLLGVEGVAGHESVGDTPHSGGYFGRSQLLRSAAAVTGACLATRGKIFLELGGFDDINLQVAFNDVDYCMKVRAAGYRVVYNPFAVLFHFESKSRGRELSEGQRIRHCAEAAAFRLRWNEGAGIDPYYNSHFERFARPFERLRPPPSERSV